jgi:hypothetical protein
MDKRMILFVTAAVFVVVTGKVIQALKDNPSYFSFSSETMPSIAVAGMPPQTEILREIASDHYWDVTCEGKSGEMTALRLTPTRWSWLASDSWEDMFDAVGPIASSASTVPSGVTISSDCGVAKTEIIPSSGSSLAEIPLAIGTREELAAYLQIAHACGLTEARIAPLRPEDREALLRDTFVEIPSEWLTMYGADDLPVQQGPFMCMGIMSARYEAENTP